jgi:threonine/homoserine/homoserine lactone efflux protein
VEIHPVRAFVMTSHHVWLGFAIGCLAAIPLGPMGMVCIQRTLDHGRLSGLASAAGLTAGAALWCVVAARGLSTMAELFVGREAVFMIALGLFLVAAGIAGLRRATLCVERLPVQAYGSLAGQVFSSFLGVLLNPVTFVTMTAVLAILGGVEANLGLQGLAGLAGAVFAGGMLVWFFITHSIGLMSKRLGQRGGIRLSKALNYCILGLGILYVIRPFLPDAMG